MELNCSVQNYAWGVKGKASSVADLASATQDSLKVDESKPYAELWMGTHPNGPSVIKTTNTPLASYIEKNPAVLGTSVTSKFGNQLPFLFKVLSVNQALSIQAHPNKSHAEELHKSCPDVYKDPNHKPEMTVALTPFLALCGFRPAQQIIDYFEDIPELVTVVGKESAEKFKATPSCDTLKQCFSGLMNADKVVISEALESLSKRLQTLEDTDKKAKMLADVFLTTMGQYPNDGGCFSLYLLNLIKLEPGQAMFLGPNIIHAYLKGDCIECMACSDNVVRAGLTPKFQDVDTLLSMLQYDMTDADSRIFKSSKIDENCNLFNPPVPDFAVESIKITKEEAYSVRSMPSCSIILVINGSASVEATVTGGDFTPPSEIIRGSVLFLPADYSLKFSAKEDVTMFRALCV